MTETIQKQPAARATDKTIAIVVLFAMAAVAMAVAVTTGPAGAQTSLATVSVNVPGGGATTFTPPSIEVGPNDPIRFVLANGSSAVVSPEEPLFAFDPCFLSTSEPECTVQLLGVAAGETVTYSDVGNILGSQTGTIVVGSGSPSPSGSPSGSVTPSSSPSASPSTSTSPSASASPSPSASATASPSASPSVSPSPSPSTSPTPGPTVHPRSVTLALKGALIAEGTLTSDDPGCYIGAPVDIQKKKRLKKKNKVVWRRVVRDFTDSNGDYAIEIPIRKGRYRARSIKFSSPDGQHICSKAISPTKRYRP